MPASKSLSTQGASTEDRSSPKPVAAFVNAETTFKVELEDLQERLYFEELLSGISSKLVSLDFDQVNALIPEILREVSQFMGVDFSTFMQVDETTDQIQHSHQWVAPDVQVDIDFTDIDISKAAPWIAKKLLELKPVVISKISDFPNSAVEELEIFKQLGLKSVLWIPVSISGKFMGCMALNSLHREITWSEPLINRLVLLGEIVADNLGRARSEKLVKESEQHLCKAYAEIRELKEKLEAENTLLRKDIADKNGAKTIVGSSKVLENTLSQIRLVAPTNATVLLLGETGTGKELLANEVHLQSPRKNKSMMTVNCAALPAQLMESELFGHEKGAYTGATSKKIGRFELAAGSTIFLDEIGELPLDLQVKLLRFLQEGEFQRLGSSKTINVEVRIIAATNRPLEKLVEEGEFRSDLYYRLNVFPITVPPLRDRVEDIEPMVNNFVEEIGEKVGKAFKHIPEETFQALMGYHWPGNVRELHNVIERAMILAQDGTLLVDLPNQPVNQSDGPMSLDEVDRQHILNVLEKAHWKISGASGAAKTLGLKPTTLRSKMERLGIEKPG